ncbi:DUF6266 family protein [Myroides pelagicus]|uniref:DUF6266 family protein n=1 Tax=Myroides pelagicus TaxID=270914 RepID=UPI0029394693|nr:DUF6266 family protein [Myroides pelagicus]MEC4112538.1 DUF6266 family protein [Myroides pelagicus]
MFSGVIVFFWRSKAERSNKSATEKQLLQQAKMTLVSSFLAKARSFINRYNPKVMGKKSLINGVEQQSSHLLKRGVGIQDNKPYLFLNLVTMSIGSLPVAYINRITILSDGQVEIVWEDNSFNGITMDTYLLSVVLFHPDLEELHICEDVGQRVDKLGYISLPNHWTSSIIHVWTMWKNSEETLNSTSVYYQIYSEI